MDREELLEDWRTLALDIEHQVENAVIGQPETIRLINVALFARGHVLLEGGVASARRRSCVRSHGRSAAISSASKGRST